MDNINVGIFSIDQEKLLIELIIFICLVLLKPLESDILFYQGKARQVYLYSTFHTHW